MKQREEQDLEKPRRMHPPHCWRPGWELRDDRCMVIGRGRQQQKGVGESRVGGRMDVVWTDGLRKRHRVGGVCEGSRRRVPRI